MNIKYSITNRISMLKSICKCEESENRKKESDFSVSIFFTVVVVSLNIHFHIAMKTFWNLVSNSKWAVTVWVWAVIMLEKTEKKMWSIDAVLLPAFHLRGTQ